MVAKLVSGRQLREARMLAGLTIEKFAELTGYQPRTVRHWEGKGDKPPTNNPLTANRIEEVLLAAGVQVPLLGAGLRSRKPRLGKI
jgi:transcriptional regulator with XRE-family HTH domain